METTHDSNLCDTDSGAGVGGDRSCGSAVCVGEFGVTGLSEESLLSRLSLVGRAESRLAAMKSQVLAEISRRDSAAAAQRIARDELQSSKREAKRDLE